MNRNIKFTSARMCPMCGKAQSEVIDTRDKPYGTYRRRRCVQCGYRFNSIEIQENELEELLEKKHGDVAKVILKFSDLRGSRLAGEAVASLHFLPRDSKEALAILRHEISLKGHITKMMHDAFINSVKDNAGLPWNLENGPAHYEITNSDIERMAKSFLKRF